MMVGFKGCRIGLQIKDLPKNTIKNIHFGKQNLQNVVMIEICLKQINKDVDFRSY